MKHPIISINAYRRGDMRVVEISRRVKHLRGWKVRKQRKIYKNPSESSWRRAVRAAESLYVVDPKKYTYPHRSD